MPQPANQNRSLVTAVPLGPKNWGMSLGAGYSVILPLFVFEAGYGLTKTIDVAFRYETVSGPDVWALFDHQDVNRAGASRDFIKWLTSAQTDAKWNLAVGNLPLRSTEKTTPEFAAYVKAYPGGQKFFDNLANAEQGRPTVPGYEAMSRNVGDAIASVLQGKASPRDALDAAAKKSAGALED